MSPAQGPINLEGIFENYNITANKSLTFTDFFGRRTIHLQGKVVTVIIPGQIYNCDKDCFAITEDTTKNAINTMLSVKKDVSDKYQQRFFFMWTFLSLRYGKQLRMKSPAHPKKRRRKDPLCQRS